MPSPAHEEIREKYHEWVNENFGHSHTNFDFDEEVANYWLKLFVSYEKSLLEEIEAYIEKESREWDNSKIHSIIGNGAIAALDKLSFFIKSKLSRLQ